MGGDEGEDGGLGGDGGALERLGADVVGVRGELGGVDGARDVVRDVGGLMELGLAAADTGGSTTSGGATATVGDGRLVVRTSFGFAECALVGAACGEGVCFTGAGAL